PERPFQLIETQEGQHLLQTAQLRAKQRLLEQTQQTLRQNLLHNSREIPFVNPKFRRNEDGHLSEIKPLAEILLLSHTRTRVKISSADSLVRAPGQFQLIEIQNRTKEDIYIPEIFPRTLMEEILQPQPNTGMEGKIIRYLETWKLVMEKRKQHTQRIWRKNQEKNIIEQIHPEQAKWFNPTFIIPKPHQKWMKILDASALNKEMQTIHLKTNGTDQVRDLIRKGDQATSLDLKSAFHYLIVYLPHRPYLAFEAMEKVYQYRAMPLGRQQSSILFAQALAMVLTKIWRNSDKRILNYLDDLLLQHQIKERLRKKKP
ncbi:MAG: hypothetical protein EZS28_038734, partial [Streblomastix strix]